MKKKAILSLILVPAVVVSTYGTVLASTTDNGRFSYDGGKFKWDYKADNKQLDVYGDTTSNPVSYDFSAYAPDVEHMSISYLDESTNFYYSCFPDGMDNLVSISVNGKCACLKIQDQCPNVERIYFNNNTNEWAFVNFTGRTSSVLPQLISDTDAEYYFNFNEYAGSSTLTVPKSYGDSKLLTYSFSRSTKLTSVSFAQGTKFIPEDSFNRCTNISSVTIPGGVTDIEYSAFRNCTKLTSVTLPSSLEVLRFNAFTDSGIKEINYGGTRQKWYGLVQEYEKDGPVQGANVLHLDHCVVHCSDGDILIRKIKDSSNNDKYIQNSYGWIKEDGSWYYFYENGAVPYDGIREIDGKKYGFDADSKMITGWGKFGGNWYFFDRSSGAMRTGWVNDNGKWYYLSSEGIMNTGWMKDGGKWYYLDPDSGAMVKGWVNDGGNWYFLKNDGSMASYEYCDGYWLNSDGTWTYQFRASWRKDSTGWWYGDTSGWYAKNRTLKIDGKNYNFNAGGYCTNP